MRHLSLLSLCAGLLLGGSSAFAALQVVTTTTMVGDLVQQVGGDRVSITGLMGPGVDPHLYKPTASDVTKLQKAQAVFYSGLMLEGRMADLFTRLARTGKKVFAVTETIPEAQLLAPEEVRARPRYFSYFSSPSASSRWTMFVTLACEIFRLWAMSTTRA